MGIPEALAIGGGVSGFTGAREQNRAIQAQVEATRRAAAVQSEQLREQAAQQRDEAQRRAQQVSGRLRAAAGDTGADLSSAQRQVGFDLGRGLGSIGTNLFNSLAAVLTGSSAQIAGFEGQRRDVGAAATQGLLGGLRTGLDIQQSVVSNEQKKQQLNRRQSAGADADRLGIPPSSFSFGVTGNSGGDTFNLLGSSRGS